MRQPPTGTVTFLFTDIEGSTKLWQDQPEQMRPALARHDQLLRQALEAGGGYVFKTVGDAFCAAFATAPEALVGALAAQSALTAEPWETGTPLRVRMALHTGSAEERGGDYYGPPLNRVARLMSAGHGGQTLVSAATQELVRDLLPVGAALRDLGDASLKDLSRPERVFQLLHPSLPSDFPPLKSLDNPSLPNNLPQQPTSFIGREREVAEVKTLLNNTRLLTLTGAGGCGKTRLSLQVAADLLGSQGDGVWLVELAPLSDPTLVPKAVAQALGVREAVGKTFTQNLMEYLRPKDLLLVLDNCEHLVAACASLVADLLRSCPHVHVLATSREPLNVPGEQTYRVPSLSLPDPKTVQTVEALSQYEAVRLFIERAQAVQPSFTVTSGNAPAVAQVCFHLDGIPLAIELAAARIRSLSVEEVNRRLDSRFRLLTGGSRVALPRQQTLRALIDWSYDLLPELEKALLCRLSVFAGGWTLAAAEDVGASGVEDVDVLDPLTALVDKSLVSYEETNGVGRYHLLETVRQYSEERLAERGETERVRDLHLSWCVALAEAAEPHLQGSEQGAWLAQLETDHDNLRAGLAWGLASLGGTEQEIRLAGALGWFWYVRCHWSEGRVHLAAALAHEGLKGGKRERAEALNHQGRLIRNQGDFMAAHQIFGQALTIAREIGDRKGEGSSLHELGWLAQSQSDFAAAHSYFGLALEAAREVGDQVSEASNLHGLGCVKLALKDLEAARSDYEQALEICQRIGARSREAANLEQLGWLAAHQPGDEAARSYFEQSLAISCEIGDRNGEESGLHALGWLAQGQGDFEAALLFYERSLEMDRQSGDAGSMAGNLHSLGEVRRSQGDFAAARAYFEQALEIARRIGDRKEEASWLNNLGAMAREQNRLAEARSLLRESLTLKRKQVNPGDVISALEEWAALALADGDAGQAARLAGAAQAGRESMSKDARPEQKDMHGQTLAAARVALGVGDFMAACDVGRAMTLEQAVEYALTEEA